MCSDICIIRVTLEIMFGWNVCREDGFHFSCVYVQFYSFCAITMGRRDKNNRPVCTMNCRLSSRNQAVAFPIGFEFFVQLQYTKTTYTHTYIRGLITHPRLSNTENPTNHCTLNQPSRFFMWRRRHNAIVYRRTNPPNDYDNIIYRLFNLLKCSKFCQTCADDSSSDNMCRRFVIRLLSVWWVIQDRREIIDLIREPY